MRECIAEARRIEADGAVLLNQFENPANPAIHELTTGPEIWAQCTGRVDAIVAGVGTGGTLTGTVRALRAREPEILAYGVESQSSVIGGRHPRPSRVEGIGNGFVPGTLDTSLLEAVLMVEDEDAFAMTCTLAREEGLLTGPSGGAVVHAALQVARKLGPGRRVVTIVPDGAERYTSKGVFGQL
jgi:cysteine synthase A